MSGAPSWQLQQLYSLWQQRQARITRWAVGTLAFAALVPILVLGPYERTTRASAELIARRSAADERAQERAAEAADLTTVRDELASISTALEHFSWERRRDALRERMQQLGADWSRLENAAPASIELADDLLRERSRIQSPIQAPPVNAPGRPVPNLQLPPGPAIPNAPRLPDSGPPASGPAGDAFAIAEAVERLGLDGRALAAADAQRRHALLEEHVEAKADEEAKASIRAAASAMRALVVKPLKDLLERHPDTASRVPTLVEAAETTALKLDQWEERFLADRDWYRTVAGKGDTMHELRRAMDRGPGALPGQPESWTAAVREAVKDQESRAREEIARLDQEREEAQKQLAQSQVQLEMLSTKLKAILPAWIGDIVSPPELMNLYAPVMIVLLAVLGACAWRIRQCYLALRATADSEGVPLDTIAEGSTWTLARRNPTATLATGAVYLGGLVLLWALFTYGTSLSASFASLKAMSGLVTPESIVDALVGPPALPSLRIAGHAAFAVAALAVVAALGGAGGGIRT